jgi:tetratricopeptide (TPR) repeat protein
MFKRGHYADAATAFDQAAALRPEDPVSHLYTGLAWQQQFVPVAVLSGAPEMSDIGDRAEREFRRALKIDPQNWPAFVLLGKLMGDEQRLDEARTLYKKALELDSTNADIWRTLGAIAWKQARRERRSPDAAPVIEQGFADLQHALALAPGHLTAMEWMDALFSLRASLANNATDLAQAEEWRRKAQTVQEEQNRLRATGVIVVWPAKFAGTWPVLRDFASLAVREPRPLPPPTPPDPSRMSRVRPGSSPAGWNFRHVPDENGPPPMLVNPAAQAGNLLTKVDPEVKGPGAVRLDVVIGRDGRVRTAKVISGEPRFADAARAAVLQWNYRPTLSNGEPVEVRTEVDIGF